MMYKHYSPRCETALFTENEADKAAQKAAEEVAKGRRAYILCEHGVAVELTAAGYSVLDLGATGEEMAENLFALLRQAEKTADVLIAVEPKQKDGVMAGVLNRLRKACVSADVPH